MKNVLIISNSVDIHGNEVEKALLQAGERVIRLNTDRFFSDNVELTFDLSIHGGKISVRDKQFLFSEIKSVWYRRPETLQTEVKDVGQRSFAEREAKEFLFQLYFCLQKVFWVSRYNCLDRARRKYPQLQAAKKFGMNIPKTIVTNSPANIRSFFQECDSRMIYKTLKFPTIEPGNGSKVWGVPTTVINIEQLRQIELIHCSGGIFQEYIEKMYELRITIIGADVFATKIDSQKDASSRIDWRDGVAYGKTPVTSYKLPKIVMEQCLALTRDVYQLAFGAIDLIRKPDGEYVFLELNPNGQWLWVEELTKQPLIKSMVKLLSC